MEKELLLFDHDGVLVDTEKWYYQANKDTLATIDISLDFDTYMEIMVAGKSALSLAKNRGYSEKDISPLRQKRNKIYQHYLTHKDIEIAGVPDVLAQLRKSYQMAIVTTSMPQDFALIHQTDKITKYFDEIFTRESYEKSKPHPEPYLTALEQFNISAEKALVIEDSERGLRSANVAGIDCITVKNKFTDSQNFSTAISQIKQLSELLSLL